MAFDFADEPVPEFDPEWRTAAVVGLAKAIADGRSDVFPILADALADAGCNDPRILDHCRDCESHREDCWVLASIEGTQAVWFEDYRVEEPPHQPQTSPQMDKESADRIGRIAIFVTFLAVKAIIVFLSR